MQSGKLRHKVTLLRRDDASSSSGQVVHTYTPFATVYARIADLTGREFFAARQIQAEVTTEIEIRWRADVDATCRISHTVRHASPEIIETYDVIAPATDAKTLRRNLKLMCKKNPVVGERG